jgi:hypothetical protein
MPETWDVGQFYFCSWSAISLRPPSLGTHSFVIQSDRFHATLLLIKRYMDNENSMPSTQWRHEWCQAPNSCCTSYVPPWFHLYLSIGSQGSWNCVGVVIYVYSVSCCSVLTMYSYLRSVIMKLINYRPYQWFIEFSDSVFCRGWRCTSIHKIN